MLTRASTTGPSGSSVTAKHSLGSTSQHCGWAENASSALEIATSRGWSGRRWPSLGSPESRPYQRLTLNVFGIFSVQETTKEQIVRPCTREFGKSW